MKLRTQWVLLALFALGCDDKGDNYIEGSVAESFKIGFDSTRVRLYETGLSVEYVEDTKAGEQIALRVTVDLSGEEITTGKKYDLTKQGTVSRGGGYNSPLPEIESGELELDKFSAKDGSETVGSFESLFTTRDGKTETLRGGFAGKLEVVSW